MAISIHHSTEPNRFRSIHGVQSTTGDGRQMVTLSGVVLTDVKGTGSSWYRDQLILTIPAPVSCPANHGLRVQAWAPFVTVNAIYNKSHAVNAGWAVDDFWGPGPVVIIGDCTIYANIAVRDVDGWLYRVGYTLNLVGVYEELSGIVR